MEGFLGKLMRLFQAKSHSLLFMLLLAAGTIVDMLDDQDVLCVFFINLKADHGKGLEQDSN